MTETQSVEALAQAVAREIEVSQTSSAIPAGPRDGDRPERDDISDTINQVFALFRVNYANQYFSAWPNAGEVNQAKRLWLDALSNYPSQIILRGARHAIETSEYLPNLNRMLESCHAGLCDLGLPAPRDAYLEACNAPSPKSAHRWSHPAVFFAGAESGWFFLANQAEAQTWPVFRDNYRKVLLRATQGETFKLPPSETSLTEEGRSMSLSERKEALAALRKLTST